MKTLEGYINEMHIEDNILKRIYFHTCIEFKLPHNLYPYIVESNGKFEQLGPRLVCQYIDMNLKEVCFDNSLLDEETYWDNLI